MKLLQFRKNDEIRLGVKTDFGVLDVKEAATASGQSTPVTLQEVISNSMEGLAKLTSLVERTVQKGKEEFFISSEDVTYAPAVTNPEKIICVGLNYINHAKESNMDIPTSPILFSKFNNALAAHQEPVTIPTGVEKMDYEAELVLIIGKTAKNVSEDEALSYVFGYTVGNDVSARDWQFKKPVNGC
ncbi:fumarylacetoacetate hydrolase family protein [Bacillus sp. MUM 116]|uniref:fumarylacetoacetate hydrolase family protein n=1 Tax=Bacillus sp. MUM 116 TaxID=1678002 RepID=UPI000A4023CE